MKFYQVPILISFDGYKNYQVIQNVVIKKNKTGYSEVISNLPLEIMKKDKCTVDNNFIQYQNSKYGFCCIIYKEDLLPKNYAKKENVEAYIAEYDQSDFNKFLTEHSYVYGTDHKEIKKILKKANISTKKK